MLNIYLDPDLKNVEVFKQVLSFGNNNYKVFSSLKDNDPSIVDIAIIWLNVPKCLYSFSNLKLILTSGSGIDHLDFKSILIKVPVIRLVDFKLRNKVSDYVLNEVNSFKDQMDIKKSSEIIIGLMGVGLIGKANYDRLKESNYTIKCWVRSEKLRDIDDVYIGDSQFKSFIKGCNILVCQLPLTKETFHILNMKVFDLMPKGSYIINVGRGGHLNEDDLIKAIDQGKVKGACLDVFKTEPLPEESVLRSRSSIKLTPHVAGGIFPREQAIYALEVISRFLKEEKVEGIVNQKLEY